MIRTLVTGATGTLGTALRPRLVEAGHAVRAASRSPPDETTEHVEWVTLDLAEPTGIESALEDVDTVIHAATAPRNATEAVDVEGTERLLEAAVAADIDHLLYPSIVGVDEIPLSYYEHKRAGEVAVEDSDVPTSVVRATQFHSFVAELFDYLARLPVWLLPAGLQVQPVDVREVADGLVDHATRTAVGRADPIGGPEVRSAGALARAYRDARGLYRPTLDVPIPGRTAAAFRAGRATCPDRTTGSVTWEEWLTAQDSGGVGSSR